jgi:hypothetical protein
MLIQCAKLTVVRNQQSAMVRAHPCNTSTKDGVRASVHLFFFLMLHGAGASVHLKFLLCARPLSAPKRQHKQGRQKATKQPNMHVLLRVHAPAHQRDSANKADKSYKAAQHAQLLYFATTRPSASHKALTVFD